MIEYKSIHFIEINKNIISEFIQELLLNIKSSLIITINLDFFRICETDPEFYKICKSNEYNLIDGVGVKYLLQLKHNKYFNVFTGNDLFRSILDFSKDSELKIALVGSENETLKLVKAKIQACYPNIKLCLTESPPQYFERDIKYNTELIERLRKSKPDVLFLALGCPRQEKWLFNHKDEIGAKINAGVGAAFDFYAGTKKRAPVFVQKYGFEWLWRLLSEPIRLFDRYILKDIPFFIKTVLRIKNS